VVVRNVGRRIAVYLFGFLQFVEHSVRLGECFAVFGDKSFELLDITSVELHKRPAHKPFQYQLEIAGAHGQERQQRQSGPEIDGC